MSLLHGVAIGDLHFDKLRKHFPDKDIALQLTEIEKPLRYCLKQGIPHAFFLGDIGDGVKDFTGFLRMSEDAQCGLFSLLRKYDGRLNIHIYIGNHDFAANDSHTLKFFFELQRACVFKTVRFYDEPEETRIDGINVAILPYPHKQPSSRKRHLCFAHYEVNGATGDNGRKIVHDEEESPGQHIFIQGHLHTRQVVRRQHFYPGTLYQNNFGESLPKGWMEFKAEGKGSEFEFRHRFIDNDPRFKMINAVINTRADLKQLAVDPYTLYKLYVQEEVRLNERDVAKFGDQIVNQLSFSDDEERKALEFSEFVVDNQELDLSYDTALVDLLRNDGLSKRQIQRGKEIMSEFQSRRAA